MYIWIALVVFSLFFIRKMRPNFSPLYLPATTFELPAFVLFSLSSGLSKSRKNKCPVCQEPPGILRGNHLRWGMTSYCESFSIPGYPGNFKTRFTYGRSAGDIKGLKFSTPVIVTAVVDHHSGGWREGGVTNTTTSLHAAETRINYNIISLF